MWTKKYSRLFFLLFAILVCGGMAVWGVQNGHRWAPLPAFVIYMAAGMLILPRLPNPMPQPMTLRGALVFVAWIIRFVGIVGVFGCVFLVVSHPFLSNPLPYWALAIILLMWGGWACGCFWLANWISNKASVTDPSQMLDLGFRFANHDKK